MPTSYSKFRVRLRSQVAAIGLDYALGRVSIRGFSLLLLQFFPYIFVIVLLPTRTLRRQAGGLCVVPLHIGRAATQPSNIPEPDGGEALTPPVFA
jgi:hypothetical protein